MSCPLSYSHKKWILNQKWIFNEKIIFSSPNKMFSRLRINNYKILSREITAVTQKKRLMTKMSKRRKNRGFSREWIFSPRSGRVFLFQETSDVIGWIRVQSAPGQHTSSLPTRPQRALKKDAPGVRGSDARWIMHAWRRKQLYYSWVAMIRESPGNRPDDNPAIKNDTSGVQFPGG